MTDIFVVGSINTDLVVRTEHFPAPGETIQGEDLQIFPGGKGANQAVAAARQGMSVAMIGRVGRDSHGTSLIANLNREGVTTSLVRQDEAPTGTAIIVVDAQGQNSIVLSPGANARVRTQDVESDFPGNAKLALFQLEIPLETVVRGCLLARQQGVQVLLNPAPARPLPPDLLNSVDILLPNETELSLLSGETVQDVDSADKAARGLLEQGPRAVVVTLGEKGSLVVMKEGASHLAPYPVEVVDTTAAGDAFIGEFTSALLRGMNLREAARYGNACGALAATRAGAQPSLPTREEAEKFIAERPG